MKKKNCKRSVVIGDKYVRHTFLKGMDINDFVEIVILRYDH